MSRRGLALFFVVAQRDYERAKHRQAQAEYATGRAAQAVERAREAAGDVPFTEAELEEAAKHMERYDDLG